VSWRTGSMLGLPAGARYVNSQHERWLRGPLLCTELVR
jgi:hypothetical protein